MVATYNCRTCKHMRQRHNFYTGESIGYMCFLGKALDCMVNNYNLYEKNTNVLVQEQYEKWKSDINKSKED